MNTNARYLQVKFTYEETMKTIERAWGPYDPKEIAFYKKELRNNNGEIINNFQKQLVFNLFYKYFGDTTSINGINEDDYIKLIISAKKMLRAGNMAYLPYIMSGKVNKIVSRKTLNKKEIAEMEASQYYPLVVDKFKNEKIIHHILGTMATIITSTFSVIDMNDPALHGQIISLETRIIIEEVLMYVLLV